MTIRHCLTALAVTFVPPLVLCTAGCGVGGAPSGFSGAGGSGGSASTKSSGANGSTGPSSATFSSGALGGVGGSSGAGQPCTGLACQIHACSGGGSTTISGKIYDPAGKNPLYGIVAYVPNTKPQAFKHGADCSTCADQYTGNPIAAAVTDSSGHFTITNAPDGPNIPLVLQVGKWRKQLVLPNVAMCTDNPQADKSLTLPKNTTEGDIPNIAISTGSADTLECLLSRVGIEDSEYLGGPNGSGHIHIYQGDGAFSGAPNTSPGAPDSAGNLWDSAADIMQFDMVVLSCEGHETNAMNQQVMFDYAAAGGRVFASHFHYAWFNTGPFGNANLATWHTGGNQIGKSLLANIVTTLPNSKPFPKGQAMLEWLGNVGALQNGELPIDQPRHNADVSAQNTPSQAWIVADQNAQAPGSAQDFSFDTPLNTAVDKQCGRVVFSAMHVGAASGDYKNGLFKTTPMGCAKQDLSPQEKALEFILFDLSSCVSPNDTPVQPPGTQK